MDISQIPWGDVTLMSFICICIFLTGKFLTEFINKKWWPLHEKKEEAKISHEQQLLSVLSRLEDSIVNQNRLLITGIESIEMKISKTMESLKVNEVLNKIKSP